MDPWIQQIAGQGITALLLSGALAWQTRKLSAVELELRQQREKCETELAEERTKREALEAQHSRAILMLGSKMAEALRFLASELRRK